MFLLSGHGMTTWLFLGEERACFVAVFVVCPLPQVCWSLFPCVHALFHWPSLFSVVISRLRVSGGRRYNLLVAHSPTEKNLHEHFRGRGHLQGLQRLRLAERSVFVRGFACETSSVALQALLEEQIGSVDKVWVSDNVSGHYKGGPLAKAPATPISPFGLIRVTWVHNASVVNSVSRKIGPLGTFALIMCSN